MQLKTLKSSLPALFAALVFAVLSAVSAGAEEMDMYVTGKIYEYDAERDYKVSSYYYLDRTSELETLGQLNIRGNAIGYATDVHTAAFEHSGSGSMTLSYEYNNSLYTSDKFNWHIIEDDSESADGFRLGGRIGSGAVLIETSPDHENWELIHTERDILNIPQGSFSSVTYTTDPQQLRNGCYFRVVVVYKLEEQLDDTKFWFFDTSDKDRKRVAEVYEFYVKDKEGGEELLPEDGQRQTVGETVNAGYGSGYSGQGAIGGSDPHSGWELGSFILDGCTECRDNTMLVKTPDEKISLKYRLSQSDLDRLGGDSDLSIKSDPTGTDSGFGVQNEYFGRGALLIRRTDENGTAEEVQVIPDFLSNIAVSGTETEVQLFDEGDYEVALDYRINEDGFFYDDQYDYRVFFKFSVRNCGCGIWPVDTVSGESLDNAVSTYNGFRLDSSVSDYLKVKVSLSQWTEKENGYSEIHIYDRAPEKDELFEEEGIYTITAINPTTDPSGRQPVIKKIYVGSSDVLRAYVSGRNKDMTVNMIADCIKRGGSVLADGTLVSPQEDSSSQDAHPQRVCHCLDMVVPSDDSAVPEGTSYTEPDPHFPFVSVLCAAGAAAAAVFFYCIDRANRKKDK